VLARAVPLVLLVAAGVYLTLALRLPFGAAARPGAGFYPVIVAVFALVVALAGTASAFRGVPGAAAEAVELDAASRRRVVISVVALGAFCLVLPWVGVSGGGVCVRYRPPPLPRRPLDDRAAHRGAERCGLVRTVRHAPRRPAPARALVS
jgi:hypothetical protein